MNCILTESQIHVILNLLLAVTEDRATLRSAPERCIRGLAGRVASAEITLLFVLQKLQLFPENLQCDKPRVRAEPDEPQAPYVSDSGSPFRFRIDSLHSITIL